ncbi:DUF1501 domain-containing protein [Tautonia rosea]|uniref:DUF1501 domain-containing protein n=1 Tax=Tautonia rosea TaxID=2728037 RepID=UPI001475A6C5|nr:DUF1501 domain-containing protein [Tautonia rosea]
MATSRTCDGVRRRDFLKIGVLGGTGLTLSTFLRLAEAGEVRAGRATSAIHINLGGGPSHLDTFDPKPEAPDGIRGEFETISTAIPGVSISEHLPKLAQCADHYTIIRGVSHSVAAHDLGTKYLNTGNRPLPSLVFPGYGAVVSKELASPRDIPPFVAIPNTPQVAGYLGVEYAPFSTQNAPRAGQPFNVRGISIGRGLTVEEVGRRRNLLQQIDQTFAGYESSDLINGLDAFSQRAYDIISSPRSREAFDISRESQSVTRLFGRDPFSQSCLLASRLVESGVRFVAVSHGGWDTHQDNFNRLKARNLPELDAGLSGLFLALAQKGLLESTLVMVSGEFGRTPKINPRGGRDHFPRAMFVVMGGGGIAGGRVIGASDETGSGPASGSGIAPDDVAATLFTCLGIDPQAEYHTPTGRPVAIVRNGTPITEAFA